MKLGYHASISGGLNNAVKTAKEEELSAIQIFPGSPRNYFPSNHTEENIELMKNLDIPKYVHINYFVNLASDKPVIPKSISENLKFCDEIGADGLVIHMGSNKNIEEGMSLSVENIKQAYKKSNSTSKILIEITAEGGNKLKIPYIFELVDLLKEYNVGVCFDTAHSYGAGYDVLETLNKYIEKIDLVHLNNPNPEVKFGGHQDKHNISLFLNEAKIPQSEIELIVELANKFEIPMILETGDMSEDFKKLTNEIV
jgi:deoxyribonuclease IV